MSSKPRERAKLVVPGDELGVIEEFLPGENVYEKEGVLYAQCVGYASPNLRSKTVSVKPALGTPKYPREGDIVYGQVMDITDKVATIRIFGLGKKMLSGIFTGTLHISEVSKNYIESILDAFRPGDIVKARVINVKNRVCQLSTVGKELGTVYALCTKCGGELVLRGRNLVCKVCKNVERRKVAEDYGRVRI